MVSAKCGVLLFRCKIALLVTGRRSGAIIYNHYNATGDASWGDKYPSANFIMRFNFKTDERLQAAAKPPPPLPPLPGTWTVNEAWTDEFDGSTLDLEKWSPTGPGGWTGRPPAWFAPGNVDVSGGMLHL